MGVMDRMWAPWRMEYLVQERGGECFLCQKTSEQGDRENGILFRGSFAFVILNAFPYNSGHLLVAPYRHLADPRALSEEELAELWQITARCLTGLEGSMGPQGFNLGINLGQAAGAGLESHLHLHIIPRWNGDTNFLPVMSETKVISEHLLTTFDKLLPFFRQ
jgi:ATP adenylyltransferase